MKRKNRRKFWGLSKWLENRREKIEKKEAEQEEFYRVMQQAARRQTFFSTKEEDDWLKAYMGSDGPLPQGSMWISPPGPRIAKNIDWDKDMKKLLKGDYDE